MDMEQRKVTWANRIYRAGDGSVSVEMCRRLVSICQDAFNEGHRCGEIAENKAAIEHYAKETKHD